MALYSVRSTPDGFRMTKFDNDLNVEAVYEMPQRRHLHCSCFQANKHICRHREMMAMFIAKKAVNSGRFFDYNNKRWVPRIHY